MKHSLKQSTIIAYGSGNLGYGFITHGITSYLMFYATAVLLLPGTWVGILISISIIWDAVSDPIMGFISDATHSRFGKRHIYIFIASILMAVVNIMIWTIPQDLPLITKFLELLIAVFLIKTFLTVFITPYSALGTELSQNYYERSKIQSIKTMFFLGALVMVTAMGMLVFFKPTSEYDLGQLNPNAYIYMAYSGSILMVITGLLTCIKTWSYKTSHAKQKMSFKTFYENTKFSLTQKNFRAMVIGYLSTNIASAIIAVFGLHVFTYTFHLNNKWISLVIGSQFIVAILAQPLWVKITEKIEKKGAIMLGLVISIVGCFILALLVIMREMVISFPVLLIVYALIVGFGSSPLFSVPPSMIGDIVDQQEFLTGNRNEGVYFGMLNFGYKISQSIAIFFLGIVLDLVGFKAGISSQSTLTVLSIGLVLSLGSLLSFVGALFAYRHYDLNQETIEAIQLSIVHRNSDEVQ